MPPMGGRGVPAAALASCVAKSVPLGQNHVSSRAVAASRLMYEQHYHFTDKPFGRTPDRKYLFASQSFANALAALQGAVADRVCFAAVTGDVGTGKTTLCRALADQGDRKTLSALLLNAPTSEEELLA